MAKQTNAQRQADYRQRKKLEKANATTTGTQQTPGSVVQVAGSVALPGVGDVNDTPQVAVNVPGEGPKLSLKERILQKVGGTATSSPAPKVTRAKSKKGDNLLATVAPTVVASFIATYSQQLIADPYKPCAPKQDEVTGIIGPLLDILARQVEITGKASQTTIDIINSIICSMMYGIRAYITYVDIKNAEGDNPREKPAKKQTGYASTTTTTTDSGSGPTLAGGLGAYQRETAGLARYSDGLVAVSTPTTTAEAYATGGVSTGSDGDTEGKNNIPTEIADMFKRDKQGRIRLGLLAPGVRDAS